MFSWLSNAWRVPELRRRVLFTALILALYRVGSWMPAPGVKSDQIQSYFNGRGGTVLGLLNLFSGSALARFSLFALGIMPYVTASIILQLMTVVIPTLERLQKEGEAGLAKINHYTRYLTAPLAVVFIQEGQRRIPIQYAKRMVGRRQTAGGSTYLPLRVNMAGVIPVIFAAAVMAFPPTIAQFFPQTQGFINRHFLPGNASYLLLEGALDTMGQMESQMMMRSYEGFLK